MPRPLLPVDCMTKSDMAKTNAAQFELLRSWRSRLSAEGGAVERRGEDFRQKGRSRAESQRQLQQQEGEPKASAVPGSPQAE
eukprot:1646696-Pyramimonas_sp.AAC.1